MKINRRFTLAIILIALAVVSANCVSSGPVSGNSTSVSYNYTEYISSYEPHLNTEINLSGHVSGNKSVKILEASSSSMGLVINSTSKPGISFQPYGDDGLDIHASIPPGASCSDTLLYLPAYATYKINIDYWDSNPENRKNNTTITVGEFEKPVVISINGNVVIDNGPIIPTPEPDNDLPDPTKISVISKNGKMFVGTSSWLKVQLYYKGEPLRKKGVNITLTSDNGSIVATPGRNYNYTDASGSTYMALTSGMLPGRAKITASYNGSDRVISDSFYVDTTRWGGIGGLVFDKNGVGIPDANVSLWDCHYNDSSHTWEKDSMFETYENPQPSGDGSTGPSGQFAFSEFYRIPAGTYVIMAEKDGHRNSSVVTIEQDDGTYSTGTSFVTLSDYEFDQPGYAPLSLPSATLNGGTIWGIVCDQNAVSVPFANVSLWHSEYNASTKQWEKTTLVDVSDNPQRASGGKTSPIGEYRFDSLPWGTYYAMAEYGGKQAHAIVHLKSNLAAAYLILPYEQTSADAVYGAIAGLAFDKNNAGIPNAEVSLYRCVYNQSSKKWDNIGLLEIPENPQLANDGRTGATGQFAFYRVPIGTYAVTAEKDGHMNSSTVTVEQGTATCFINLSDTFPYMAEKAMDIPSPALNGGTIWGIACDQDRVGIPNANVSLWHCEYNGSTGQWEKTTLVDVSGNPQLASDGKSKPVGEYRFDNLPHGLYYITASDNMYGFSYYAIVRLNTSLAAAYVVLPAPGCRFPPAPTPTPAP